MTFRIRGLDPEPFTSLFSLDDEALAERAMRRLVVDEPVSAPCRVTLEDAAPGETVILLEHQHQPARTPFRASGPIFVRETASRAFDEPGRVPEALRVRTLSARAYDAEAMMIEGELVEGEALAALLERWLARPEIEVVHLHYARRGCFAAVAERA